LIFNLYFVSSELDFLIFYLEQIVEEIIQKRKKMMRRRKMKAVWMMKMTM